MTNLKLKKAFSENIIWAIHFFIYIA